MTQPDFELHVLVGEPSLFMPEVVDMADLLVHLGPEFREAPTGWLGWPRRYCSHDVLIEDEDRRVVVMARSLATDFGGSLRPCLLLPSLASASRRGQTCEMLAALLAELERQGEAPLVVLHGVDLAGTARSLPIVEAVLAELTRRGLPARLPDDPVRVVQDGSPAGQTMVRNLYSCALTDEVATQAAELGLGRIEPERLMASCMAGLAAWTQQGLEPSALVGTAPFRQLASTLLHHVIAAPAGKTIRS